MKKYIVTIIKTESYSADIEVMAENSLEAEAKAIDLAQDKPVKWNYEESDFSGYAERVEE